MIGLQTELKLAHLVKTIADCEKQVEVVRQVLAEQRDFEPYTAFKRIDNLGLGYIRVQDLHDFLRDNGISATERDVLYLFKLYDSNGDQRLTYSNFLNAVLPVTSPALRQLATQRESYFVGRNETLPYDVEWSLSRVFDKEINAYRKIELLKDDLVNRYDYDGLNAFKTVDIDRLGYLDHETIYQFFQRNKIIASDDDVLALLRRLDKDQDGRISYAEFVDGVTPVDPYSRAPAARATERSSPRSRSIHASPRRQETRAPVSYSTIKGRNLSNLDYYEYLSKSVARSPRRSASPSRVASPRRVASPSRAALSRSFVGDDTATRRMSPVRESISKRLSFEREQAEREAERLSRSIAHYSPSRSRIAVEEERYRTPNRSQSPNRLASASRASASRASVSRASATRDHRGSPLRGNEEEHLAKALKDQIELDKELENLRNDLALKSDFNLLDAFKIFDVYGKGYITSGEFEDGLREFNAYPTRDELYLVFRKFDKNSDGLLRYSEFCELFTPRSADYAGILTNRIPSYVESRKTNLLFGYDTRRTIQKFFGLVFQNEAICESVRQRLNRRPLFDIYDAFKALDKNENGYITLDEFKELLLDHGIYSSSNELLTLMKRFDKDQDGKVSYSEFVSEITPKSPTKLY